jgi:hypothetical protein
MIHLYLSEGASNPLNRSGLRHDRLCPDTALYVVVLEHGNLSPFPSGEVEDPKSRGGEGQSEGRQCRA